MTGRSRTRASFAFVVVALTLGVCETNAAAQAKGPSERAATEVRAKELFTKGDAAYAEGRYEEALAAFQEAYDLSGRAQLLFNVSNALERLGRYEDALAALEKYLASGKARDRDVVQKRIANLKKRVDEKKEAETRAKEEEEKKRREEEERRARGEPVEPSGGTTTPGNRTEPKEERPVLPIVLMGAGGVLLVTGAVFGALALSARSEAESGCLDGAAGHLCSQDASSALDREQTFGIVADVGIVTGIIAGAVGAYLFFTHAPVKAKANVGGFQLGGTF